ncbi:ATP-dependent RNA helicase dbp7 [Dispira parvispora]|uniref:ATP-dependent RNA helicase n=1 Tax=Dispira parvispora TaxID=1520584 RepID=A0A9W8ART6_9FUNG|nr:ATP-dependent RNA helicase dbp7 [Dispira parvispora]
MTPPMTDSNKDTSADFSALGLDPDITSHLATKMGISQPTPIQKKAIPAMLRDRLVKVDSSNDTYAQEERRPRDICIQAQTGSGKTLTFLLPIVHRLLLASTAPAEDITDKAQGASRNLGSMAVIITPTHELAKQILSTLEQLLRMTVDRSRRAHWMVPGIVVGGENPASEKARLRKGVTILVTTPGRLLRHLQVTQSFVTQNLRWLVLDEADRLLEEGFEETLKSIMTILDERMVPPHLLRRNDSCPFLLSNHLPRSRQVVLCSATLPNKVLQLAGTTLTHPLFCRNTGTDGQEDELSPQYEAPSQLRQYYIVMPAKLRLVTLAATLMQVFPSVVSKNPSSKDTMRTFSGASQGTFKVVIFLSSCDSVDFHHVLFSEAPAPKFWPAAYSAQLNGSRSDDAVAPTKVPQSTLAAENSTERTCPLLPGVMLYKLHGNLPQKVRADTFSRFSRSSSSSILLCTDVAARGLDFPHVNFIIQYDPPAEVADYVHRVGRTARIGRQGESLIFLTPTETDYLDILRSQGMVLEAKDADKHLKILVKRKGKGQIQVAATDLQQTWERWVHGESSTQESPHSVNNESSDDDEGSTTISAKSHNKDPAGSRAKSTGPPDLVQPKDLAQAAFLSSVRAYATHVSSERHIFHIRKLHLGHWAKSFGLRETPTQVGAHGSKEHNSTSKGKSKGSKSANFRSKDSFSFSATGSGSAQYGKTNHAPSNPFKRAASHADEFSSGIDFGGKKKRL